MIGTFGQWSLLNSGPLSAASADGIVGHASFVAGTFFFKRLVVLTSLAMADCALLVFCWHFKIRRGVSLVSKEVVVSGSIGVGLTSDEISGEGDAFGDRGLDAIEVG